MLFIRCRISHLSQKYVIEFVHLFKDTYIPFRMTHVENVIKFVWTSFLPFSRMQVWIENGTFTKPFKDQIESTEGRAVTVLKKNGV